MNDYDIYLRDGSVRDGQLVGFALAWKGLTGVAGLPGRPHKGWFPWILDPNKPDDPTAGHWGVRQWRFELALLDGMVGLQGAPSNDGRTPADMRADLMDYLPLTKLQLQDLDGAMYDVRMTSYIEQAVEPYDNAHPNGGMLVQVEFAEVES
jgi:hypothetical protein